MRLVETCALLVFGAAIGGAAPPQATHRSLETLKGDWETVIASPRRPWIFTAHFKPASGAWKGTLSVESLGDFLLTDVRVESTRVHFRFPPQLDSIPFDGTLGSDGIVGQVPEAGQMIPARLTRVVPLPAPRNRLEAWRQDLDVASARLSEYDRSFTPRAREDFRHALAELKRSLPRRNDAEVLVGLSQAVAMSDNAHTRLRLDPTRQGSFRTEFPIRMWWFSDGAYVIRAAPEYRRVLGCRVVAVNGLELGKARDEVTRLFAGNDSWAGYLSPIYLESPDVLYGLRLIPSMKGASFTFQDVRGARFDLWLRPERINQSARGAESWQELSPIQASGEPRWTTALEAQRFPLYLLHPDQAYWFEFLPQSQLLYFQFNRSDNAEAGPTFREFGDSLLAFVKSHPVRGFVVDLRLNSGGNLDVAQAFMRGLAENKTINQQGRLFVIVGRCTFSAGLYHAAQLKQFTQATFVGEPVGDRLDYWAEGGEIVLPNSRARICYANGFHRYSTMDYSEHRPYYEELKIPNLVPDIRTSTSSADYFAGRDPALEAILAHVRQ